MTVDEFKEKSENLEGPEDVDTLCFAWFSGVADDLAPRVRAMMLLALEVLRAGVD